MSCRERSGFPLHVEYALTDRGRALNDALDAVADWGHAHAAHLRGASFAAAPIPAARSGS